MKKVRKIIAILLTVLTLMSVISAATPVLAVEVTELTESAEETSETVEDEQNETATKEAEILYEDTSRRDEYTKHFKMSNGLNKAVKYAQPIHYKENDEWVNIDNTLEYNQETEKYENKANSFKVKFDKKIESEELFSIENEGYTMFWRYSGNSKRNSAVGKVEKSSKKNENLDKHKPKANGKIKYDKFESDCNLEYVITGTGIKENIILESYSGKNKFSFEVKANGLEFIKNENKSISVVNQSGAEIFYIPAPFMFDADNNYSYDVDYSIESKKNKSIITVIADKDWLEDKERKYPVTIDPSIETDKTRKAIDTTFVASGEPSTNFDDMRDVYIGVECTNYEKCRALVKFDLPELNSGDMVIGATLGLWLHSTSFYTDEMPDNQINAHIVTSSWNAETVTWNTKPVIKDNITDYNFIKKTDVSGSIYEKVFDVTRAVKEWYEGTANNYGIMIKSDIEDGSDAEVASRGIFWSDKYNDNSDWYPYIEITYRNNKGLEGYWDYSSFGVGAVGTAHVNDYTGNLVYELPVASSISEIMPVSIVGYYNNYCANELIRETEAENVRTSIGRGFRLSYQQTVLPSSKYGLTGNNAETYPYVYTDDDGTEHYIQKVIENEGEDNEKITYKDEDGLGLTLTKDCDISATYQLTDKEHNNYYFNNKGNLFKIKDSNGNETKIIYKDASSADDLPDKSRIDKIVDGAGHTYKFTYNVKESNGVEMDYVSRITDDGGREYRFYVSSGLLQKVTYPDGNEVTFDYNISSGDSSEGRINAVYSNGIYELNFDYTSKKTGRRVKTVKEYGEGTEKGQVITFDRTKYNTTIMRSCGLDGKHYIDDSSKGNDDIITTIQYDNMGRAISQQMKFGSGDEISAGSCAYTTSDSDDTASGFKNKVSGSGATGKYVENLLYGGNAESDTYWSFGTSGNVNAEPDISTASKYIGKKSLKLIINEVEGANGRCYYRQNYTDNIKDNTEYTLSAYVKTGDLEAYSKGDLKGAFIQIIGYDSSGNAISSVNARSQIITERTDLNVNNGWRRLSCTVKTGTNVNSLRCYLFLRNMEGSVCFDGIQLEKGGTANNYNMLENSHFTMLKTGNQPKSWEGTSKFVFETGKNGVIEPSALPDEAYYDDIKSKTFKITGSADVEKGVTQTVTVEGNPDDTYILSGWAKGFPLNSTFHTSGTGKNQKEIATFEIAVKVNYTASDGSDPSQFKTPASFNTTITDWQCASVPISLKYTGGEDGVTYTPKSIKIIPRYHNQENFVFFDKIMLVKDVASSYTYDNEGNLISAASNSEQKANMKYNDDNNLTSYTDAAGFKTELTYEDKNNINYVKSANGVYTNYDYDSKGNVTSTEVRNKGKIAEATAVLKTTSDYYATTTKDSVTINAGAYKTADYDQNGNATTYVRDHKTGTPISVTDAKNVVTNYEYYPTNNDKPFGKQKSVSVGGSKVTYDYNTNKQLSKIIFGNTKKEQYSFVYDGFGNVKQTLVGSQSLSTNTFKANNGPLAKTTYGNGDIKRFTYNNFGQKAAIYGTDANSDSTAEKLLYSWTYNDSGVGLTHTDHVNQLEYIGDYDSLGRLSKEETQNSETNAFIGSTEYGYDIRNNLTSLITNYGGKGNKQQYFYTQVSESTNSADYQKDNLPTMYKLNDDIYALYRYGTLNRYNQRNLVIGTNTNLYYNYIYKVSDRNASGESKYRTTQIAEEYIGNDVYLYGYDVLGNITSIKKAERTTAGSNETSHTTAQDYVTYSYDDLGQLTEEKFLNKETRKTWLYDELGNITNRNEYKYVTVTDPETNTETEKEIVGKSVVYTYTTDNKSTVGWNNLLTSVKTVEYEDDETEKSSVTETITYDQIGNPTSYLGASLKWNGRELTSYTEGDTSISYKYDADGLRTSKTVNGVTSKYFYVNGQLHYEERSDGTKLYFFYDSNGFLTGLEYNNTMYYPATNKRGDVVALYYANGKIMGRYEYDAWGNVIKIEDIYYDSNGNQVTADLTNNTTSRDLLVVNPIRYRGYYYDSETKLYYLQSRYYNPEVGRFLNADGYLTTDVNEPLTYNMFAYCMNNPVNYSDPSGMMCGLCMCTGVYPCPACMPPLPEINSINLLFGNVSIPTQPYIAPKSSTNNIADSISTTYDTMDTISGLQSGFYMNNNHYLINSAPSVAENFGKAVSIGLIGYETVTGVCNNYLAGATNKKIVWDAAVDVTVLGSTTWCCAATGAAICAKYGTMISPGIGTAYGAAGGALAGALFSLFSDDAIEYLKGLVK